MPADYRAVEFPPVDLEIDRRPDGAMVMTPRMAMVPWAMVPQATVPRPVMEKTSSMGI